MITLIYTFYCYKVRCSSGEVIIFNVCFFVLCFVPFSVGLSLTNKSITSISCFCVMKITFAWFVKKKGWYWTLRTIVLLIRNHTSLTPKSSYMCSKIGKKSVFYSVLSNSVANQISRKQVKETLKSIGVC